MTTMNLVSNSQMRITADVEIPDELIQAASAGALVLFVGAGVSRNAPSGLPLFDGLTEQISDLYGATFDGVVGADVFMGRLCDEYPMVREQVRSVIGASSSKPNDLHRGIVRLASASGAFRVVTTNYDEHLTTAAVEAGIEVGDIYFGPAVPLGRSVSGLVHLHGAVSRPAAELVLTDGDFGRAYLTDGWARRFVQDLFMNCTVLFVGYSHNDEVMKYLARGLPPETRRFALTDIPEDSKWKDLRIAPISYPSAHQHLALTEVVHAWADRLSMGQLDHHVRIKEIVRGVPPKLPVEADYVSFAITTPAGVRAFVGEASGPEWLLWAEDQPTFRKLFTGGTCGDDQSRVLASWFTSTFIENASTPDMALGTLARMGPVVCDELIQEIARAAYWLRESSPEISLMWCAVVSGALRTFDTDLQEHWLILHDSPIVGASAMPHLRRAVVPRLVLAERARWLTAPESSEPLGVDGTIAWSSDKSDFDVAWKAVQQDFSSVASSVLQVFEQALRDAYDLKRTFDAERTWDSMSFRRAAIEPHTQDRSRDFESNLIDGLRDAGLLLSIEDKSIRRRWLSDDAELFRRLGVHLLGEDGAVNASEKLKIILDADHLFDRGLKHEVFHLLAAIAPALTQDDRAALVERALQGPPVLEAYSADAEKRASFHERSIFDLLEWLGRDVADWPELETALADIRAHRPNIGVRPHPDVDRWMESGVWGSVLPFEVDEFISIVVSDGIDEAIAGLLIVDYSEREFGQPTWDDACSLIRQVVNKSAEIGLQIMSCGTISDDRRDDLVAAVLQGWAAETHPDEMFDAILPCVNSLVNRRELAPLIAELCLSAVNNKVDARSTGILDVLDRIAVKTWITHSDDFERRDSDDWMMLGLNTWPGYIAQYWLNRIRLRWRIEGDNWQGLSFIEADSILMMLETTTAAGEPALAILAADTHFLFAADPAFAEVDIFPVFDGTRDGRARHAWMSYLHHPRVNTQMLENGFWTLLLGASDVVVASTRPEIQNQYWRVMASLAVYSDATNVNQTQVVAQLAKHHVEGYLPQFLTAMADTVSDSETVDLDRAWSDWLRDVMRARCEADPGEQWPAEKAAWGDIALRMRDHMDEALRISTDCPGPLGAQTIFEDVRQIDLQQHFSVVATAVNRRIQVTNAPDWRVRRELEKLVARWPDGAAEKTMLRELAESAMAIGIHGAANWVL